MTTPLIERPAKAASDGPGPRLTPYVQGSASRVFPLSHLLFAELLAVCGLVGALGIGVAGYRGALAGLLLALVFSVRAHGRSLAGWLWLRLYYLRSRTARPPWDEPFDAALPDGAQIGFHWDGRIVTSLVRIEEDPLALTVMESGATVSGAAVPVRMLAESLQQFDIAVDSIDVISTGYRSLGSTRMSAVYEAVLGPLPAIAHRSVWVAVRVDPTECPDAVRRRGGGWPGILRTAATATQRVANQLAGAGLRPRIGTASDLAAATAELVGGVDPQAVETTWTACRAGRFLLRSHAVAPKSFTTSGLGSLWTVPSHATSVCVTLRREGPELGIAVRGLVRFDTRTGGQRDPAAGLAGIVGLPGQQHDALLCGLPVPAPDHPVGHWVYGRDSGALADLALPASGCGQVIGADVHGRAVALPIVGPAIARVEICGALPLAQQVVLRSLALGARVRVHTDRSPAWQAMVDQVADRRLLAIAAGGRGAMQAGAAANYTAEVFDGVPGGAVRVGVTVIEVRPPGAAPSGGADVTVELLDSERNVVRVGTRAGSANVSMVATDDEMLYLSSSFAFDRRGGDRVN